MTHLLRFWVPHACQLVGQVLRRSGLLCRFFYACTAPYYVARFAAGLFGLTVYSSALYRADYCYVCRFRLRLRTVYLVGRGRIYYSYYLRWTHNTTHVLRWFADAGSAGSPRFMPPHIAAGGSTQFAAAVCCCRCCRSAVPVVPLPVTAGWFVTGSGHRFAHRAGCYLPLPAAVLTAAFFRRLLLFTTTTSVIPFLTTFQRNACSARCVSCSWRDRTRLPHHCRLDTTTLRRHCVYARGLLPRTTPRTRYTGPDIATFTTGSGATLVPGLDSLPRCHIVPRCPFTFTTPFPAITWRAPLQAGSTITVLHLVLGYSVRLVPYGVWCRLLRTPITAAVVAVPLLPTRGSPAGWLTTAAGCVPYCCRCRITTLLFCGFRFPRYGLPFWLRFACVGRLLRFYPHTGYGFYAHLRFGSGYLFAVYYCMRFGLWLLMPHTFTLHHYRRCLRLLPVVFCHSLVALRLVYVPVVGPRSSLVCVLQVPLPAVARYGYRGYVYSGWWWLRFHIVRVPDCYPAWFGIIYRVPVGCTCRSCRATRCRCATARCPRCFWDNRLPLPLAANGYRLLFGPTR
jgi:hypothetical protein